MTYKAYIETEDEDFAGELINANIPGVEITTRLTAAFDLNQVAVTFMIDYSSSRAIKLFFDWLETKVIKRHPYKTRYNGRDVPLERGELRELEKLLHKFDNDLNDEED